MSKIIHSFRDLNVYQHSFALQQLIFEITKDFPREERYALTDQMRRSSRSVGANLAEAWQKRRYLAHCVAKLTDADGEHAETEHWLETATRCGYLSKPQHDELMDCNQEVGHMLGSMLATPEKFCRQS